MTKNKTLTAWLALWLGALGAHRFYLYGRRDLLGWLLPVPSLAGLYGVLRAYQYGLDDRWSWVLIPLLGLTLAGCALSAIVYGLTSCEQWNARFNAQLAPDSLPGRTHWLTIGAVVCALMLGATVLLSTLAYSFEHYFDYQMTAARLSEGASK